MFSSLNVCGSVYLFQFDFSLHFRHSVYLSSTISFDDNGLRVRVMVFNATFNNISVISWHL
jgi:hypothetical protein